MTALRALLADLPVNEWLLAIIVLATLAFTLVAIAFTGIAFLLRVRNIRVERRWRGREERWEEAVIAVLGGERSPLSLAAEIAPRDGIAFAGYLTRFARRLRGEERRRLAALAQPFLGALARRARARDDAARAHTIQALSLLRLEGFAPTVVAALDDPSPLVAMTAARALARRDHPEMAAVILAHLDRFTHWDRHYLAAMLAAMGPGAASALHATLADDRRPAAVRAIAADALRTLNHLPAADEAARLARTTADRDLRAACLRLLRQVGRPEHLDVIRAHLHAADDVARALAVAALGAVAEPGELPSLVPALDDASPWVAFEAARALAQVPGGGLLRGIAESGHRRAELIRQVLAELPA